MLNDLAKAFQHTTGSAITTPGVPAIPLPAVRCAGGISVRQAVESDLPFIDQLQKMHSHMVGFAPRKQIEANIAKGEYLIAEEGNRQKAAGNSGPPTAYCPLPTALGYCHSRDQYMKRDDVGIVYQLNVVPLQQRHLIGATLIKAVFERAAYGCKLFCCWCAQDIRANWFWESIGFLPLAFRTGSRSKQRIHIFWQRRIREGDETTPYWFPSQTTGGAVSEDRLVIPIPPGTHWRDAMPLLLPDVPTIAKELPKELPGGAPVSVRPEQPKLTAAQKQLILRSNAKEVGGVPIGKKAVISGNKIRYVDRSDYVAELDEPEELKALAKPKRARNSKPRQKHDPKMEVAARELRDKYLEQVNAGLCLPPSASGKYDVSRQLEGGRRECEVVDAEFEERPERLLDAA